MRSVVDQTIVVEPSISDTGVIRISQYVVHSIYTERITHNDFRENRFPIRESQVRRLLWSYRKFLNIFVP